MILLPHCIWHSLNLLAMFLYQLIRTPVERQTLHSPPSSAPELKQALPMNLLWQSQSGLAHSNSFCWHRLWFSSMMPCLSATLPPTVSCWEGIRDPQQVKGPIGGEVFLNEKKCTLPGAFNLPNTLHCRPTSYSEKPSLLHWTLTALI